MWRQFPKLSLAVLPRVCAVWLWYWRDMNFQTKPPRYLSRHGMMSKLLSPPSPPPPFFSKAFQGALIFMVRQ